MIRAAVIGVGYLGKFHAQKYASQDGVELAVVVDSNAERASEIAYQHSCRAISDYRQIDTAGIDCASVAADTSAHYEIAAWLLERGVDVLVEKPMTATLEQAKELVELAESKNRILQVGHLERFNPAFRSISSILDNPRFFEARRIAAFTGRAHDVDVVLDLMIHDIDIISHLVNKPLARLEAVGIPVLTGSIDIANARINFEGGAIANVTASRAASHSERTIKIFQPNVYVSLDYGNKKLKVVRRLEQKDSRGFNQMDIREHAVEEGDALRDEIASFVECVRTRTKPEVSGRDGMRALQMAEDIRCAVAQSLKLYM